MTNTSSIRSAILPLLALVFLLLNGSCRSRKEVSAVEGKQKVAEPFTSKEYRSDEQYLRYVASEESRDLSSAKSVAFIQAQTGIAMEANKEIEGMFTNYLNFDKSGENPQASKHIQYLFDGIVQIRMPYTRIIGEEAYRDPQTGFYTYYVASEVSINELEKESLRLLQEDERLKTIISENEYREVMEKKIQERKASRQQATNK